MKPTTRSLCSATMPMQFRWRRQRMKSSSDQGNSKHWLLDGQHLGHVAADHPADVDRGSLPCSDQPLERSAPVSSLGQSSQGQTSPGLVRPGQLPVHIRWMIRRDMPEVLAIEEQCFEFPWSEEDFIRCLRQRNCIGMVAEHSERVVGFMIYELHKNRLHILNFAVHAALPPPRRRRADDPQADQQALARAPQPDHAGGPRDEPAGPALLPRRSASAPSRCSATSTRTRPKTPT